LYKYEDVQLPAPDYRPSSFVMTKEMAEGIGVNTKGVPAKDRKIELTADEKERINLYQKQFMRRIVRGNLEVLDKQPKEKLEAALKQLTMEAQKLARREIFLSRIGSAEAGELVEQANRESEELLR